MSLLFDPLTLRGLTLGHRAWVAPMCQYSCDLATRAPSPTGIWCTWAGSPPAGRR